MTKDEYRKILIIDIKQRGYRWETVMGKGGSEIPLDQANVGQLKAIKYQLQRKGRAQLLHKVNESLGKISN
jgi:hypothetical protein